MIYGAMERLVIGELRVIAVLGVVGPCSVGVDVPADLGPLVGEWLGASVGKALQHHIVALCHVAFAPAHGYRGACCREVGDSEPGPGRLMAVRMPSAPKLGEEEPRGVWPYLGQ